MPKMNKVVCSFPQGLLDLEKKQARDNIGALGYASQISANDTITVDSNMYSNGYFSVDIPLSSENRGVLWLDSIALTVQQSWGEVPSQDTVPLHIQFKRTYTGGAENVDPYITGLLTRTASNGPWVAGIRGWREVANNVVTVTYNVGWSVGVIPVGTRILYHIRAIAYN
jgi:hypothetical protein